MLASIWHSIRVIKSWKWFIHLVKSETANQTTETNTNPSNDPNPIKLKLKRVINQILHMVKWFVGRLTITYTPLNCENDIVRFCLRYCFLPLWPSSICFYNCVLLQRLLVSTSLLFLKSQSTCLLFLSHLSSYYFVIEFVIHSIFS